jgi:DNA repair protein RadC
MAHGSKSVESVLEALRRLWKSIEVESPPELQSQLKREIDETISRLKWRIEKSLRASRSSFKERLLFEPADEPGTALVADREEPAKPRFPQAVIRIYDKDLVEHALAHVPEAIKFSDIQAFREHLIGKIRSNSLATRRRIAGYLLNRFFPGDVLHKDLAEFASKTAGKPALSDALFYLTCRMEPIVASVADEVVFPSLPEGGVARSRVKEFVQSQFLGSKSASDMSQAIIRTFERFGIGAATRTRLNVSLREGSLAAFGYVLHLEFPEPGMYSFERLLNGPMHRWLLWDQQWMSRQLYSLREAGLLSKVSEIDRLRQFTTKYTLAEAVQPIVALAKESPP